MLNSNGPLLNNGLKTLRVNKAVTNKDTRRFFLFTVKSFVPPGIQCRFRGKWHSKRPDYHKTIERKVMYHIFECKSDGYMILV